MTSLHTSEINTHQITLHSQKIKPIRADKSHTKDKSRILKFRKNKKGDSEYRTKTKRSPYARETKTNPQAYPQKGL